MCFLDLRKLQVRDEANRGGGFKVYCTVEEGASLAGLASQKELSGATQVSWESRPVDRAF